MSDPENLMRDFSNIRHEGSQNHSSSKQVAFYHQKVDDPDSMASSSSLASFEVDGVQMAAAPSCKNFQLVFSTAFRKQYRSTEEDGSGHSDVDTSVQMGKLTENQFSCLFRPPFTLMQTFLVALSRFETQQKY